SVLFADPAAPERDTLSLHDALPIWSARRSSVRRSRRGVVGSDWPRACGMLSAPCGMEGYCSPRPAILMPVARADGKMAATAEVRSEEHTSELQSRENLVCRLLLEKK